MNKRFRCVIAGWLLLMLCACTGGTDEPHIRYYRLASGQSENYLANQACQRFCDMVRRETDGAIQILPSFDNELGTDASALEQCVYGGIDFCTHANLVCRSVCTAALRRCSCRTSTPRTSTCSGCWTAQSVSR